MVEQVKELLVIHVMADDTSAVPTISQRRIAGEIVHCVSCGTRWLGQTLIRVNVAGSKIVQWTPGREPSSWIEFAGREPERDPPRGGWCA